ncbi:unnamed protein product, partial [Didymodactylos carnosus]
MQKLGFE